MGLDQLVGRRGARFDGVIGAVGGMAYFGVRADSVQEDWHASTARLAASAALLCAAFSAVCAVLPADALKASIETSLFTTWAGYALMVARIGAGFGGGGIYTLAAALESRRHTPVAVGLASTGVVFGQVVLYLVGWLLLLVLGLDDTGPQWRCIFAFGALMALLCAWRYYSLSGEAIDTQRRPRTSSQQTYDVLADAGVLMSVQLNGMAWFLQNFANYGISLVYPFVLDEALPGLSIQNTFGVSLLVSVGAFGACCFSLLFLRRNPDDPSKAVLESFATTLLTASVSILVVVFLENITSRFVACILIRIVVGLPSATLYAYPVSVAPPEVAAAAHGLVAGAAKAGAVLGTVAFYPIYDAVGFLALVIITAGTALLLALARPCWRMAVAQGPGRVGRQRWPIRSSTTTAVTGGGGGGGGGVTQPFLTIRAVGGSADPVASGPAGTRGGVAVESSKRRTNGTTQRSRHSLVSHWLGTPQRRKKSSS